ncbi:hypothetical protein FCM35_KLT14236 [Carex littledalei]|uniref:Uncharacterized protein n=1 Tax=Carex littledalei TaxID=544730 RepID=A0A833VDW9_9POAL|nr:hypothetical protein FCM35_KLT14236 [Carex littledalei]
MAVGCCLCGFVPFSVIAAFVPIYLTCGLRAGYGVDCCWILVFLADLYWYRTSTGTVTFGAGLLLFFWSISLAVLGLWSCSKVFDGEMNYAGMQPQKQQRWKRASSSRVKSITLSDIEKHYDLPLAKAAEKLVK